MLKKIITQVAAFDNHLTIMLQLPLYPPSKYVVPTYLFNMNQNKHSINKLAFCKATFVFCTGTLSCSGSSQFD